MDTAASVQMDEVIAGARKYSLLFSSWQSYSKIAPKGSPHWLQNVLKPRLSVSFSGVGCTWHLMRHEMIQLCRDLFSLELKLHIMTLLKECRQIQMVLLVLNVPTRKRLRLVEDFTRPLRIPCDFRH